MDGTVSVGRVDEQVISREEGDREKIGVGQRWLVAVKIKRITGEVQRDEVDEATRFIQFQEAGGVSFGVGPVSLDRDQEVPVGFRENGGNAAEVDVGFEARIQRLVLIENNSAEVLCA